MSVTEETSSDWLKISQEWEESGLSQVEYCKSRGISRSYFSLQRSKLIAQGLIKPYYKRPQAKGILPKMHFVPVTLPVEGTSPELLSPTSLEASFIEIKLPHGILMRIPTC